MVLYADNFDRPDSSMAAPWVSSPSNVFKIVNNSVQVMTTTATAYLGYNQPMETINHQSTFHMWNTPSGTGAPAVPSGSWSLIGRGNSAFTTYYGFRRVNAAGDMSLYKVINGTLTTLKTVSNIAIVAGDRVSFRLQNDSLFGYVNDTLVISVYDSSITTGNYTGLRTHSNSIGVIWGEWHCDDINVPVTDPNDPTRPVNPKLVLGNGTTIPVGEIRFSWEAASDSNGVIASYVISRKVNGVNTTYATLPPTQFAFAATGLTPGSSQNWFLYARDNEGNYSPGVSWTFVVPTGSTTPPVDPPAGGSDNFTRTNGALSSPWTTYPAASVQIVDNAAQFMTTTIGAQAVYGRGEAGKPQSAKIVISNVSGTIAVLAAGTPGSTGSLASYYGVRRAGPSSVTIVRSVSGATPVVLASISSIVNVGDVLEIRVSADYRTVSAWVNNNKVVQYVGDIPYTNENYVGVRSMTNAQGFRFDDFSTGVTSDTGTPTAPDLTPPATPTLNVSNITATSATLTATSSDASGIAGYKFYKGSALLATQASGTYQVTGLTAGTQYTDFSAAAVDSSANSNVSPKSSVVFKTLADSTTPPTTSGPFQWLGKSFLARGDSSGNVQGTTGTDFDNAHTWPYLVAKGWADTTNPSVPDPTPYPNGLNLTVPSSSFAKNHTDNATAQDVFIRMLNGSTRWVPGSFDVVSIFVGGNDVGYLHGFPAGEASYRNSLSAILGLLRANSSPVQTGTTTGTWSTPAVTGSGKAKVSTNPGDTFTYTFSGSNATFLALAATSGAGSNFTYQLDGGAVVSKTTKAQSMVRGRMLNSNVAPVPVHFRNLSSGSHTLKITHTGSAGDPLVVDSVLPWLTSEADMPFVLMVPPGLFSEPSQDRPSGAAGYPDPDPDNEDVYKFRGILDSVLAEFGFANNVGVVSADLLDANFPPTAYGIRIKDGLHPNLQGNKVIADVILESLAKYPTN